MQGRIVTKDLLENNFSVLMGGRDKSRILHLLKKYKKTEFRYIDVRNVDETAKLIKESGANVVVNCVEGDWNLRILKACIKTNASCIDLGSEVWMTKRQLGYNGLLKKRNLIAITGIGSVPGVGSIMLRYAARKFDKLETIEVGFSWDSNMKKFVVPFSIQSIIEEFTDPAPEVKNRKFYMRIPMDTIVIGHHRAIGNQKEFFVRHPEQYTFYKYFKDQGVKNIRFYAGFPKHSFDKIMTMIELGFSSKKPIKIQGVKIAPGEFLAELLKRLKIPKGYTEKENLWVKLIGKKDGKNKEILMECIVPTLKGWEDAGCNIDTGMPASILAQMIKTGIIQERGSFAPEAAVPPEPFFKELRKRKMIVFENGKVIN